MFSGTVSQATTTQVTYLSATSLSLQIIRAVCWYEWQGLDHLRYREAYCCHSNVPQTM